MNEETRELKVIVDHRERRSGIIIDLGKKGFNVEVRQLPVADFIIQTKDRNGTIHSLGIEKKTQLDFLSSIMDKRLMKQLVELKKNFTLQLIKITVLSDNMFSGTPVEVALCCVMNFSW